MDLLGAWRIGKAVFNALKQESPDTVEKLPQPIRSGFELGQAVEAIGHRANEVMQLGRRAFQLRQRSPLVQQPDGRFAPDEGYVMSCISPDVQERFRTAAASTLPDPERQRQEMIRAFCTGFMFERLLVQFGHMAPSSSGSSEPGASPGSSA